MELFFCHFILRSENDVHSIGASTISSAARSVAAGRLGNTRIQPRSAVRIPSAKSIPNLSQVGVTPSGSKSVSLLVLTTVITLAKTIIALRIFANVINRLVLFRSLELAIG